MGRIHRQRRGIRRAAGVALAAGCAGALLPATSAEATWSIILVDTRTGEIAIGCATCLTSMDLQEFTPMLLTGIGAGMAQSAVNGTQFANRTYMRDRMALGLAPGIIIGQLGSFDGLHASRQYGIADIQGRRATFTGPQAGQWAGGTVGSFTYTYLGQTGSVTYAIQGNVLTGSPVVQQALAAARDTPGDMPTRLMAAMEAARAMGGDGRCSCTGPGGPTGCGSPPPVFTKSAHIGYMIVARAGDADGSQGYYRMGGDNAGTAALVLRDFDGDGRLDVAGANSGESTVGFSLNNTPAGSDFTTFTLATTRTVGVVPGAIGAADFNGDGLDDLVTVDSGSQRVSLLPGTAGGTFGEATAIPLTGSPTELAIADFDGSGRPDIAVLGTTGVVHILRNDGTGGFIASSVPVAAGGRSIVAAQLDGAGGIDLIVPVAPQNKLAVLLGDGLGGFTAGADIPVQATPHAVAAGDFDGDGDTDLAVAHQSVPPAVSIQENTGAGFTATTIALTLAPNHIAAGDVNGDADLDLIVPLQGGGRFTALIGGPGVSIASSRTYDITADFAGSGNNRVALGDVDNDGDLDAVFAVSTFASVVVCENLGGGVFQEGGGSASGRYFMNFDIANQPASAPDPVLQMADLFGAWQTEQVGKPDAVQSLVAVPAGLIAGSSNTGTMTVTLRDREGSAPAAPVASLTVEHAPGSAMATSIGAITPVGAGVYEVALAPTAVIGVDRFIIRADIGGPRPIALMPRPSVAVGRCPADWNADDSVNSTDISAFLTAWLASVQGGTLVADFNGDMAVNSTDISAFLTRWLAAAAGGC